MGDEMDEQPEEQEAGAVQNKVRRTVAISKSLAWGASGLSLVGILATANEFYKYVYSRTEGVALEKSLSEFKADVKNELVLIRTKQDTNKNELATTIVQNQAEQTRVLERKIDKVLEFRAEDKTAHERTHDRMYNDIAELRLLIGGSRPKSRPQSN